MRPRPKPWPKVPELTAQVARAVAARGPYPLAMRVRDELGEAFGSRGRPGWSPGQLALVTVLQFAENLTDRAAAHRVRYGMDLKYALGLELDDPGFDASVLSEFRTRLVEHGMEEKALDLLLIRANQLNGWSSLSAGQPFQAPRVGPGVTFARTGGASPRSGWARPPGGTGRAAHRGTPRAVARIRALPVRPPRAWCRRGRHRGTVGWW